MGKSRRSKVASLDFIEWELRGTHDITGDFKQSKAVANLLYPQTVTMSTDMPTLPALPEHFATTFKMPSESSATPSLSARGIGVEDE